MTLPIGTECDACNEFAGSLEQSLLGHNRIGPILVLRGVRGRRHRARRRIGRAERDPVTGNVRMHGIARVTSASATHLDIEWPDNGAFDDGRFRRALHHIGLNHLALVDGAALARSPRFDRVRRYVRYGELDGAPPRYAQFMYPDDTLRPELGCRFLRWAAPGCVIQIRTLIDDFYVDLDLGSFIEAWAVQALPRDAGVL